MTFDDNKQILLAQIFDSTGATPKSYVRPGEIAQYGTELYELIHAVGAALGAKQYTVECVRGKRQVDLTNCFSFVLSDLHTALKLSEQSRSFYRPEGSTVTREEIMDVTMYDYYQNDFYELAQSRKFLPPDLPQTGFGRNLKAEQVSKDAYKRVTAFLNQEKAVSQPEEKSPSKRDVRPSALGMFSSPQTQDNKPSVASTPSQKPNASGDS